MGRCYGFRGGGSRGARIVGIVLMAAGVLILGIVETNEDDYRARSTLLLRRQRVHTDMRLDTPLTRT